MGRAAASKIPTRSTIRAKAPPPLEVPFLDTQSPLTEETRREDITRALDGIDEQLNIIGRVHHRAHFRAPPAREDVGELRTAFEEIKGWADIALANLNPCKVAK